MKDIFILIKKKDADAVYSPQIKYMAFTLHFCLCMYNVWAVWYVKPDFALRKQSWASHFLGEPLSAV